MSLILPGGTGFPAPIGPIMQNGVFHSATLPGQEALLNFGGNITAPSSPELHFNPQTGEVLKGSVLERLSADLNLDDHARTSMPVTTHTTSNWNAENGLDPDTTSDKDVFHDAPETPHEQPTRTASASDPVSESGTKKTTHQTPSSVGADSSLSEQTRAFREWAGKEAQKLQDKAKDYTGKASQYSGERAADFKKFAANAKEQAKSYSEWASGEGKEYTHKFNEYAKTNLGHTGHVVTTGLLALNTLAEKKQKRKLSADNQKIADQLEKVLSNKQTPENPKPETQSSTTHTPEPDMAKTAANKADTPPAPPPPPKPPALPARPISASEKTSNQDKSPSHRETPQTHAAQPEKPPTQVNATPKHEALVATPKKEEGFYGANIKGNGGKLAVAGAVGGAIMWGLHSMFSSDK